MHTLAKRVVPGILALGLCGVLLAACSSSPKAIQPPAPSAKDAFHIEFTSDQGVMLPHEGATFKLQARVLTSRGHVIDEPISWRSTAPHEVAVSHSGLVRALVSVGSSNVVATAKQASPSNAQVVVAKLGPNTVLVPPTAVIARTADTVTLRKDAATGKLAVGDVLLSGSQGGLLTEVTSLAAVGSHLVVQTRRASLAQAFTHLVQQAQTPLVHALLSPNSGGVALTALSTGSGHGPVLAKGMKCTGTTTTPTSASKKLSAKFVDPTISVPVAVRLVAELKITTFSVSHFELAIEVKSPIKFTTGSVTVSAAGTASVSCKLTIPSLSIPTPIWLAGMIEIEGTIAPTIKVTATIKASGSVTISGPVFTDTATALDGVKWDKGAGWSSMDSNQQSGLKMTPATASYKAALSAAVEPQFRLDAGVKAHLGPCFGTTCTLAGINLAFVQVAGKFTFGLTSPLNSLAAGYSGPHWGANVTLQAGPELALSGKLVTVLKWIGITPPKVQLAVLKKGIPLANSPKMKLDASSTGKAVTLALSVPKGFDGDKVDFVTLSNGATIGKVVASTTVSNTAARASWTLPNATWTGKVVAELFDSIFGGVGLPYASPDQTLPTPLTPSSSSTTTTTSTPTSTTTTTTLLKPKPKPKPSPTPTTTQTASCITTPCSAGATGVEVSIPQVNVVTAPSRSTTFGTTITSYLAVTLHVDNSSSSDITFAALFSGPTIEIVGSNHVSTRWTPTVHPAPVSAESDGRSCFGTQTGTSGYTVLPGQNLTLPYDYCFPLRTTGTIVFPILQVVIATQPFALHASPAAPPPTTTTTTTIPPGLLCVPTSTPTCP